MTVTKVTENPKTKIELCRQNIGIKSNEFNPNLK